MPFTSIGSAKITGEVNSAGICARYTDGETETQKGKGFGSLIATGCWSWESVLSLPLALTGQVMEAPSPPPAKRDAAFW